MAYLDVYNVPLQLTYIVYVTVPYLRGSRSIVPRQRVGSDYPIQCSQGRNNAAVYEDVGKHLTLWIGGGIRCSVLLRRRISNYPTSNYSITPKKVGNASVQWHPLSTHFSADNHTALEDPYSARSKVHGLYLPVYRRARTA